MKSHEYKCHIFAKFQAITTEGEELDYNLKVCTVNKYINNDAARNIIKCIYPANAPIIAFRVKREYKSMTFDGIAADERIDIRDSKWYKF